MTENGVFNHATPRPPPTVETYLSHGELEGGFPHIPNPTYPTFTTASLFTLLNSSEPI